MHRKYPLAPPSLTSRHLVSASLLSIRGGNQVDDAADAIYIRATSYFNNLRVPAAVLMSIVMKEMFALQATPPACMRKWDVERGVDHSKGWRVLRYSYLLLMVLAFSLETFTIFTATQVLTQLATAQRVSLVDAEINSDALSGASGFFGGGGKDVHVSLIDFLMKNFEFEYATCRLHFVTGLLTFAVATALRVRYALRKYRNLSLSGMCCLLTTTTGMLAYSNANAVSYGGYLSLMKRQLELSVEFLKARARTGPLSTVTLILGVLTIYYAIRGYLKPDFSYFDYHHEDDSQQNSTGTII